MNLFGSADMDLRER